MVNYFNDEIKIEFLGDFYRNLAYKLDTLEETDSVKKVIQQKKYYDFVNEIAGVYHLLMDNTPGFLDKMQIKQDLIIRSLPEDRKQHEAVDFIKVIANDIWNNAVITNVINFIKTRAMLESNSYSMNLRIEKVKEQKHSNYNHDVLENLIVFKTEKVSPEEAILRHSILFEKYLLKYFKESSNTDASINTLLISESTTILSNLL